MRNILLASAAVLAFSVSASAAGEFKIDAAHSAAYFTVRHMMVSNVHGSFSGVSGSIVFDERDASKSSVTAVIDTASIDTGNEARDKDLRSASFFDVEKFPQATFESQRVEKRGEQWVAIGTLTIKGVSRQIELPFEISQIETSRGARIGATAELKLNRQDFGITWNRTLDNGGLVVSNEVRVELSVEAVPAP